MEPADWSTGIGEFHGFSHPTRRYQRFRYHGYDPRLAMVVGVLISQWFYGRTLVPRSFFGEIGSEKWLWRRVVDDLHLVWCNTCLCNICIWDWGSSLRHTGIYLGVCLCTGDAKNEEHLGRNSVPCSCRFSLVNRNGVLRIYQS